MAVFRSECNFLYFEAITVGFTAKRSVFFGHTSQIGDLSLSGNDDSDLPILGESKDKSIIIRELNETD